jgi:hypothetical protein
MHHQSPLRCERSEHRREASETASHPTQATNPDNSMAIYATGDREYIEMCGWALGKRHHAHRSAVSTHELLLEFHPRHIHRAIDARDPSSPET